MKPFGLLYVFLWLLTLNLNAIEVNEKLFSEVARTYGYVSGQTYSLDAIARKYQNLSNQVFLAKSEFDLSFSKSIENIDTTMAKLDGWKTFKKNIPDMLAKQLDFSNLTYNESAAFLEVVKQRAKGEIETPVLETLLMFNPTYEKKPEKEFYDGFKKRYVSDNPKKSKDVDFSLHVPMSWSSQEANRPNIVRKFISQNGHGLEYAVILVYDFPGGESLTAADIKSSVNQKEMKEALPPDANLKNYGFFILETLPGYWQHYTLAAERINFKLTMETVTYTLFYRNKLIQIQFATSDLDEKKLDEKFKKFKPLFEAMANSFVLTDLYTNKK